VFCTIITIDWIGASFILFIWVGEGVYIEESAVVIKMIAVTLGFSNHSSADKSGTGQLSGFGPYPCFQYLFTLINIDSKSVYEGVLTF